MTKESQTAANTVFAPGWLTCMSGALYPALRDSVLVDPTWPNAKPEDLVGHCKDDTK